MAGLKGNVAWWAIEPNGSSGAKGVPATSSTRLIPFSGGNVSVTRETANFAETDSSRDQGTSYTVRSGVEGNPEAYVRDSYIHILLAGALGSDAVTGATPNKTHTITPANSLPYHTMWRMQSDVLWEKFDDCMISELSIKGDAGAPLTATASVMGLVPTRLTTNPVTSWAALTPAVTAAITSDSPYTYNNATVSLGGAAVSTVKSFELQINNNVKVQQTDSVTPYDVVPGQREVTLSFDLLFENIDEYNLFNYGSTSGTAISSEITTRAAEFTFAGASVNNSIKFNIPRLAYEAFPVEPNAGGDPITVSVRAQAQRGSSSIITAEVKNQVA